MSNVERKEYSAEIDIYLVINGKYLDVAQVGEGLFILQQPRDLPPSNARLVIVIDGKDKSYPVVLFAGASESSRMVRFVHSFERGSTVDSVYSELKQMPHASSRIVVSATSCPPNFGEQFFE